MSTTPDDVPLCAELDCERDADPDNRQGLCCECGALMARSSADEDARWEVQDRLRRTVCS